MLPTYPRIVRRRRRLNQRLMKQLVARESPILGQIGQQTVHEGSTTNIRRPDGSIGVTEMRQHSATAEITRTPIGEFSFAALIEHFKGMAQQFAETMTKGVFESVSEGADSVGNVVDGKGRPLSAEVLLEALEQIDHEFDEKGEWHPPTIVVSPAQYERLVSLYSPEEVEQFNIKVDEIVEKKRREHRRREAGRVLAG